MEKRLMTFATILLFLLPLCLAQTNLLGEKNQATISPLGQASFDITVSNERVEADTFFLELSDVSWSLSAENMPDFTTGIDLSGLASKDTTIFIKPNENIEQGTYYVELRIKSQKTKSYSKEMFIIKVDPKVVDYSIKIQADVLEPTSIDPQKTNSIKVLINNVYPVYLENITIEASSKFLNKKVTTDISPKSEKVIEFTMNIDGSTPKQEDVANITVTQNGKIIASAQKTIYIKEYKLPYKTEEKITKGFLYTTHEITFTNTEGAQKTRDASIEKLKTFAFLVTSPSAKTELFDDKEVLVWTGISLGPNESHTVNVTEDYRPVAGIILLIVILIIAYYIYRSPVVIAKKAYGLHKKDTGNNEIKVILHVKNRSGGFVENVRVLERLPLIHKVEPDFGPETPEPKFRRSGINGVILDWEIALAPHEERIFTYKIRSALPIVGQYTLRPCVVQYGKNSRRTSSEAFTLFID